MAQVINTNIASLIAQNNLNQSQNALTTAIQRLSSGKRINSAADNAAGYAISQQFTAQINGLNQAAQNANDGISFAQTAGGALTSITNSLQTIRQLAVQSANATNSASDRASLNQEVQQQIAQINSVAGQTQFNGLNVLNGSTGLLSFQVGANQGQTISVSGVDVRGSQIGSVVATGQAVLSSVSTSGKYSATSFSSAGAASLLQHKFQINGTNIDTTSASNVSDVISAINAQSANTGVTASQEGSVTTTLTLNTSGGSTLKNTAAESITINGHSISVAQSGSVKSVVDAINQANIGVTATSGSNGGSGTITLKSSSSLTVYDGKASGNNSVALFNDTASFGSSGNYGGTFDAGIQLTANYNGSISISATGGANASGAVEAAGLAQNGYGAGATFAQVASAAVNVNSIDISSFKGANQAMSVISSVIGQISSIQSTLGAVQNRFQSTITNLNNTAQNLTAARSRIQDTNFAQTTANLTRAQILQQAGTAMVAQANKLPNTVLQLLQ